MDVTGYIPCTAIFACYHSISHWSQYIQLTQLPHETGASTKKWIRLWSFCSLLYATFHWRSPWTSEEARLGHGTSFDSTVYFLVPVSFSQALFSLGIVIRYQFGRKWFEPEEASGLRRKIRNLLREEFKNANEDTCEVHSQS